MAKKIIFLLFLFLFLFPLVSSAAPVTQVQSFAEGYELRIPQDNIIQQNKDYMFEVHIFNITNGYPVIAGISCYFHLYDSQGEHQLTLEDNAPSDIFDYEFNVSGTNFSKLGVMYANYQCNGSVKGGFSSDILRVTYNGEEVSTAGSVLYGFLLLIFIFFMFGLFFLINQLPSSDTKDEEGKLMSISYLKYLRSALWFVEWMLFIGLMYLSSNIAFAYLGEQLFAKTLFVLFRIMFIVTPVIVVIWLMWFFVRIVQDKKLQGILNRGLYPTDKY